MPTVTSVSGWGLLNLGPLTTTFAGPASCATARAVDVKLGRDATWAYPGWPEWYRDCNPRTLGDCFPSGSAIDEDQASRRSALDNPGQQIYYHSPRTACPSGWTTAGYMVKDNDGALTATWSPQRAITPSREDPAFSTYIESGIPIFVTRDYLQNVYMNALEPGESGIACCPSGYSPDYNGRCFSSVAATSFPLSTACKWVTEYEWAEFSHYTAPYTWNGTVFTGVFDTFTGDPFEITSEMTTLDASQKQSPHVTLTFWSESSWDGSTVIPYTWIVDETMLLLATSGPGTWTITGLPNASATADENDDGDESGDGDNSGEGDDSAAIKAGEGVAGIICALLAAWGITVAIGGMLVVRL